MANGAAAGKKKILIVDDDPRMAELLADFFDDGDFETRVVTDPREALAAALELRPDLVTLDLEMPEMDGLSVLRALRGRPETAAVPVLIISAVADNLSPKPETVQGLFNKPVAFRTLLDRVRGLLSPAVA